jgi:hypothetical protein
MEVDQGPNWGCSAKEKKLLVGYFIYNLSLCKFNMSKNYMHISFKIKYFFRPPRNIFHFPQHYPHSHCVKALRHESTS